MLPVFVRMIVYTSESPGAAVVLSTRLVDVLRLGAAWMTVVAAGEVSKRV